MSVAIRLSRCGAKKRAFYHIVSADSRSPRDGRYIERLGYFNPIATGNDVELFIRQDRVDYWITRGAKPSERVNSLIKRFKKLPTAEAQALAREKKHAAAADKRAKAKAAAAAKTAADVSNASTDEEDKTA